MGDFYLTVRRKYVTVQAYVSARDAGQAAAKLRQFFRSHVPLAVVDGSGVEVAVYVRAEVVPAELKESNR